MDPRKSAKWLARWAGVWGVHALATFFAWVGHPGNRPESGKEDLLSLASWKVLELPLFSLLPSRMVDQHFELTLVANSAFVALVVVGAFYAVSRSRSQRA